MPAYLIAGDDVLKRDVVLKRLRTRLESMGDLSFNFDTFDAQNTSGNDIVAACNTLPFASPLRLVQVNGADSLKKADVDALVSYLAAPNETTVLALVGDKLDKKGRLYKAVSAFGAIAIIDCSSPKRAALPKMVRSMASDCGITLTEGAAVKLVDLVGEDTVRLDAEVKKLALAHQGTDAVDEREVEGLVVRSAEVKVWEFVDAFSKRDTSTCVAYLDQMPSASPYALLARCVSRLRELVCARAMIERNTPQALAAALKQPDWRVKNHLSWARGFTDEELHRALDSARDTERAMKSGTDPQSAFLDWVLAVTATT